MKKIVATVSLLLVVSMVFAQQRNEMRQKGNDFSPEEVATLQTKKMTLQLDLTDKQQKQVYELIKKNAEERQALRSQNREKRENLSKEERFNNENVKLDKQIAHKAEMKKILNEEQFAKWENSMKERMRKGNKPDGKKFNKENKPERFNKPRK